MNKIGIWFVDNIWWPLFGKEQPVKIAMTGEELKAYRKQFGLTSNQMAKMLEVSKEMYILFERRGLLSPHDTQGPSIRIIQLIAHLIEEISQNKTILKELGYKGKM